MSWLSDFFDPTSGTPSAGSIQLPTMAQAPTNVFSYDPSQIAPTQSNLLGGIGGLSAYNLGGQFLPNAATIGGGMLASPYAQAMQLGAGTAGGLGTQAALNQFGAGGSIYGTAFDPQQDLYNRTLGRVTDQARANAMAAGLGTTPLGVGATDWATNQFNIDWQNAQLGRQIAGGQAGAGLQAGAMPLYMQGAGLPWGTQQQIGGAGLGTIGNLSNLGISAAQIPGQQISGWQNAIPMMAGLQAQANQQQQQQFMDANRLAQLQLSQNQQQWAQQQQAFNEQQQVFGGLGKVLGGVGGFALGGIPGAMIGSNIFGGGGGTSGAGWGFGGSNPFSGFSTKPFGGMFSSPGATPTTGLY